MAETKKGTARSLFREVINGSVTQERIQELVDQTLSMDTFAWAHCSTCRKNVKVEIPDLKKRIDGLIALLEQGEGKPDSEAGGVTVLVHRPPWPGGSS